jgi:hypothetical protein
MFRESLARRLDYELGCIGPIDARSELAFDANAKCIGGFLVGEVLALALAAIVVVIDEPGGFGFASGTFPSAFAD